MGPVHDRVLKGAVLPGEHTEDGLLVPADAGETGKSIRCGIEYRKVAVLFNDRFTIYSQTTLIQK